MAFRPSFKTFGLHQGPQGTQLESAISHQKHGLLHHAKHNDLQMPVIKSMACCIMPSTMTCKCQSSKAWLAASCKAPDLQVPVISLAGLPQICKGKSSGRHGTSVWQAQQKKGSYMDTQANVCISGR
jgi:hypothetical protein